LERRTPTLRPRLPVVPEPVDEADDPSALAVREGRKAEEIAAAVLRGVGFADIAHHVRVGSGVEVSLSARDQAARLWHFDVSGAFTTARRGLRRSDTMWNALGRAAVQQLERSAGEPPPLNLLTTELPPRGSHGWSALTRARGHLFVDALEMLAPAARARLGGYARGESVEPIDELLGPIERV
jgi:hypothetical protein